MCEVTAILNSPAPETYECYATLSMHYLCILDSDA